MTLIAIATIAIRHYAYDTVSIKFSDAITWGTAPESGGFSIYFLMQNERLLCDGFVMDNLGHSTLFATTITEANINKLNGRSIVLPYRRRTLPGLPATTPLEELEKYFDQILLLPET